MRTLILLGACLLTATTAIADTPATKPADEIVDRPGHPEEIFRGHLRGPRHGTPRPELTEAALAFTREHSPRRFQLYEQLDPEGEPRKRVTNFITARYGMLRTMQARDPALYQMKVRQIELEDEIFGLVSRLRAHSAGAEDASLRQQLQQRVGDLMDSRMSEREFRIQQLERSLQQEKERLAADKTRRDELIASRVERYLTDGKGSEDAFRFWGVRPPPPPPPAHDPQP